MDVRFVTSNDGKFREVAAILAPYGIRVRRVRRVLPEPQTDQLETVVTAKLGALPPNSLPTIVEDSGLFIPSLNGFPGVYSAHFYRVWGFGPIQYLLRGRSRRAVFRTVAGLRVGRRTHLFVGECIGTITPRTRGEAGFGFDPIFQPVGTRRTYSQMPLGEKNRHSHRARAFIRLARFLSSGASKGVRPRPGPVKRKSKGTKRASR